jgi:hypothetical protein
VTDERALSNALDAGLAGVALFRWGWAGLETDTEPPSLPFVTLARLNANVAAMDDMCDQTPMIDAETTVETHVWQEGYEAARLLQDTVRDLVMPTGWRLQAEQDAYDGVFRAWRISAQWQNTGPLRASLPPEVPGPTPSPPPEFGESLFVPLTLYVPPVIEPPPVRAFSTGFDQGFA